MTRLGTDIFDRGARVPGDLTTMLRRAHDLDVEDVLDGPLLPVATWMRETAGDADGGGL